MKRTVRCRWCYKSGHNKLSCPQMKEEAAKNPNGYAASILSTLATRGKERKCSFCSQTGHNRKTCSKIIEDGIKIIDVNKIYRKKLLDFMKNNQIGVGALVRVGSTRGYNEANEWLSYTNQLALVTEIDIEGANCLFPERNHFIVVEFLNVKDWGGTLSKSSLVVKNKYVKDNESPKIDSSDWESWEIVSPGHFMMDDEEKFLSCSGVVEKTMSDLKYHRDIEHALKMVKI